MLILEFLIVNNHILSVSKFKYRQYLYSYKATILSYTTDAIIVYLTITSTRTKYCIKNTTNESIIIININI